MLSVIEHVASSVTLSSFIILAVIGVISWATKPTPVPSDVPWVGKSATRIFPKTRAALASFFTVREIFEEGYKKARRPWHSPRLPLTSSLVLSLWEVVHLSKLFWPARGHPSSIRPALAPRSTRNRRLLRCAANRSHGRPLCIYRRKAATVSLSFAYSCTILDEKGWLSAA